MTPKPLQDDPSPSSRSRRSILSRIFTSTIFALFVLLAAGASLVMLYLRGRTLEAGVGAALLLLAAFLIYRGSKAERAEDD